MCESLKGTQTSCARSAVGVILTPGKEKLREKTFTCPSSNIYAFLLYLYYNLGLTEPQLDDGGCGGCGGSWLRAKTFSSGLLVIIKWAARGNIHTHCLFLFDLIKRRQQFTSDSLKLLFIFSLFAVYEI